MSVRSRRFIAASLLIAACSSQPSAQPTPQASSPTLASPTATRPTLPAGAVRLVVSPGGSRATIRVREQLASVTLPGDAVLTTSAFSGSLVLLADGTFTPDSMLVVTLESLKSDSDLRDEWIKINTLQTRLYPHAEFAATRVEGIPLPLPSKGEWNAKLAGTMKIHGTERPLVWDLKITRAGTETRASGATSFRFGDYGMAVPANRLVLSVVDDVRLEIDVAARDD